MLHRSLLPALVAALATLAPMAADARAAEQRATVTSAAAAVPRAEGDAPLVLSISSLTPSTTTPRGRVRITGTVTNRDDVAWSTINFYPFASTDPMTTPAELATAAAAEPDEPVGDRVTSPGPFDTVETLDPGETAGYSVSVRTRDLGVDEAGVYWFGVHALGENAEAGRDDIADGRARTFMPRVRGSQRPVETALVVPLRRRVTYEGDGSLAEVEEWTTALSVGGRLHTMLGLGSPGGGPPVTWLVDPALLDAVARLAAGNPSRSLRPTLPEDADTPDPDEPAEPGGGSPEPSGAPTPSGAEPAATPTGPPDDEGRGDGEDGGVVEEPDPAERAAAAAAESWLSRLRTRLSAQEVLVLPYGDLDLAAAARHDPVAYQRARQRTGDVLAAWEVTTSPAVAPPAGHLSRAALALAGPDETILVGDRMFGERFLAGEVPTVASVDGRRLVVASSGASSGGPGPDDRLGTVALRQRILAEAAVRRLAPGRPALALTLPQSWVPRSVAGLVEGLDTDWIDLTTVADLADRPARPVGAEELTYPARQARRELGRRHFTAADALTEAGSTLQNLLVRNHQVAREVAGQALTSLSYTARARPRSARLATERSRAWIEEKLRGVSITAPPQVYLSSRSGRFSATVANELDQPVTVRIHAVVDDRMEISAPEEAIVLAPRSRRSVLMRATTDRQGVHNVTLVLTDLDGSTLGSSDRLPIRAAEVSGIIWLIIGAGCALLLGAVALRLVRRVRGVRGPAPAPVPGETDRSVAEDSAPAPA